MLIWFLGLQGRLSLRAVEDLKNLIYFTQTTKFCVRTKRIKFKISKRLRKIFGKDELQRSNILSI